ncbi:MAG: hypothetical protein H6970_09735 [Gammaproteobacteria bacterium]|nr:hypothetical protein [Gammaproteobacteria bacterium]
MIASLYDGKPLRESFPCLQRFLHFRLPLTPLDDRHVWKTFLRHSQLSAKEGRQAVAWGHLPYLEVADPPKNVYGMFNTGKPQTIAIATCVAEKFETDFKDFSKRANALFYLRAIILHELVHWGDWNSDGIRSDEGQKHENDAGRQFEEEAFYKKVYPKEWIGDY